MVYFNYHSIPYYILFLTDNDLALCFNGLDPVFRTGNLGVLGAMFSRRGASRGRGGTGRHVHPQGCWVNPTILLVPRGPDDFADHLNIVVLMLYVSNP